MCTVVRVGVDIRAEIAISIHRRDHVYDNDRRRPRLLVD